MVFGLGGGIQAILSRYDTADPFKYTLGGIAISALFGAAFSFGGIALLFGMGWYYATRAFSEEVLPGWARMPANYYRDALWIGLGETAGFLGLERFLAVADTLCLTVLLSFVISFSQ